MGDVCLKEKSKSEKDVGCFGSEGSGEGNGLKLDVSDVICKVKEESNFFDGQDSHELVSKQEDGLLKQVENQDRIVKSNARVRSMITEREVKILKFINEFGFCEIRHIMQYAGMKRSRCYAIMKVLQRLGYVHHAHILSGWYGVYYLTQKGAEFTDYPPLHKISKGNYDHQLFIVNVYLRLRDQFPGSTWLSERKLINDKHSMSVGRKGHLPDGVLIREDGKQIAIEIEISMKAHQRLDRIFKAYSAQFVFVEVWYFCSKEIVNAMRTAASSYKFIKIHNLQEFLR